MKESGFDAVPDWQSPHLVEDMGLDPIPSPFMKGVSQSLPPRQPRPLRDPVLKIPEKRWPGNKPGKPVSF